MTKRHTWNKAYPTEGAAHLEIAHAISLGDLATSRKPRVEPYTDRTGKTKFKITVAAKPINSDGAGVS